MFFTHDKAILIKKLHVMKTMQLKENLLIKVEQTKY